MTGRAFHIAASIRSMAASVLEVGGDLFLFGAEISCQVGNRTEVMAWSAVQFRL